MKLSTLLLIFFCVAQVEAKNKPIINGKPIRCDYDAYNCLSYEGEYPKLHSCADVRTVFEYCGKKKDPSDLDRDGDGFPCENDCGGGS